MNCRITFLYGNRNEESIVFREELDHLEKVNQNLRVIHTLSRLEHFTESVSQVMEFVAIYVIYLD